MATTSNTPTTIDNNNKSHGRRLNIVLQEDLTIRGGAQLWLVNCGTRLCAAGHDVTILLPKTSALLADDDDELTNNGPMMKVETYDADKIANDPESYKEQFTNILRRANVCVALVRQQRNKFQNVSFIAQCIADADLKTQLIAKTGTPDPTYKREFYGTILLNNNRNQCSVITIAEYTKTFIVNNMNVPSNLITNVYNGTDTTRFKRTPEMAIEAMKRYPCVEGAYVVGCIGSYEPRKSQIVLLEAAKKLVVGGRLPNIYCLFVGEGPDKQMLQDKITEYGLQNHAVLCEFTKQPFYVFERCNVIALPSTGKEGLPNVLLEALAMEKPCVATRAYGMPEVVIDDKTGYCFESGNVDALADSIVKIAKLSPKQQKQMATNGKELIFSEHDKAKQFEKILTIIQDKATLAF